MVDKIISILELKELDYRGIQKELRQVEQEQLDKVLEYSTEEKMKPIYQRLIDKMTK